MTDAYTPRERALKDDLVDCLRGGTSTGGSFRGLSYAEKKHVRDAAMPDLLALPGERISACRAAAVGSGTQQDVTESA